MVIKRPSVVNFQHCVLWLERAVMAADRAAGAAALAQIRPWATVNLALGVVVLVVTLMRAAG